MSLSPTVTFLIVLVIGIAAGLFDRLAGPNWFKLQIAGAMPSTITSALVGVAGAFVGFHLAAALKLSTEVALLGAAVGAAAVLFGWRSVR
jgi:CBS-domain-containing membrane protein